jgi:hypothetical protein
MGFDNDVYVFQKAYKTTQAQRWIRNLAKHRDETGQGFLVLDMCDPEWLDRHVKKHLLDLIPLFDMATAPTRPLLDWLSQYLPAYIVPDGIEPEAIVHKRPVQAEEPKAVWVGHAGPNMDAVMFYREQIQATGVNVDVMGLKRTVSFEEFLRIIVEYDIFFNPQPDIAPFNYKSDNKDRVAWLAGLAVAKEPGDLLTLKSKGAREIQIEQGRNDTLAFRTALCSAQYLTRAVDMEISEQKEEAYV